MSWVCESVCCEVVHAALRRRDGAAAASEVCARSWMCEHACGCGVASGTAASAAVATHMEIGCACWMGSVQELVDLLDA
eukprot:26567-Chlamydomonas_euryale.AAC.2